MILFAYTFVFSSAPRLHPAAASTGLFLPRHKSCSLQKEEEEEEGGIHSSQRHPRLTQPFRDGRHGGTYLLIMTSKGSSLAMSFPMDRSAVRKCFFPGQWARTEEWGTIPFPGLPWDSMDQILWHLERAKEGRENKDLSWYSLGSLPLVFCKRRLGYIQALSGVWKW